MNGLVHRLREAALEVADGDGRQSSERGPAVTEWHSHTRKALEGLPPETAAAGQP